MVRISSVCLQSQRSWKGTQSDQRIWMNHSGVDGPLAPGRGTAWLDFPLSGAILCNVTDTSLKQHCHSLLSGSIFFCCHFPVGEEQGAIPKTWDKRGNILLVISSQQEQQKKKSFLLPWQKYKALQGVSCKIMSVQMPLQSNISDC